MRLAVNRRPSTASASGATKRASPRSTVAPKAVNRASESVGAMAAMTLCTWSCTAVQSISGSGRRTPKRPAPRAAAAACDAASSALLGTQPKLRQSPPIRSRSISTTRRPSCAATAVTDRPAAPAPTTAKSKSGIRALPVAPGDRQQRERREAYQRAEDAGREDDAEIRRTPLCQHLSDAGADGCVNEGPRDDAEQGGRHIGQQAHAAQRRRQIDEPEREGGDEPDGQQVAEAVACQRLADEVDQSAATGCHSTRKVVADGEEQHDGADARAGDCQATAEQCAEQQSARHRYDRSLRQRQRNQDGIGQDVK